MVNREAIDYIIVWQSAGKVSKSCIKLGGGDIHSRLNKKQSLLSINDDGERELHMHQTP